LAGFGLRRKLGDGVRRGGGRWLCNSV